MQTTRYFREQVLRKRPYSKILDLDTVETSSLPPSKKPQ
jgi:hypothetical protein